MESEQISSFLNFAREASQKYSMANQDEQDAHWEMQDVLHSLELKPHSYNEYAKLAKKQVDIRKRRRKAKDTMAVYEPIVAWVDQHKEAIKSLEKLLGEVRKAENIQRNRTYINKTKILED